MINVIILKNLIQTLGAVNGIRLSFYNIRRYISSESTIFVYKHRNVISFVKPIRVCGIHWIWQNRYAYCIATKVNRNLLHSSDIAFRRTRKQIIVLFLFWLISIYANFQVHISVSNFYELPFVRLRYDSIHSKIIKITKRATWWNGFIIIEKRLINRLNFDAFCRCA